MAETMTGDELRAAIEQLWPGHGGQEKATAEFGWKDSRTLRKYLSGEKAVPGWLEIEIRDLLERFPGGMKSVDPRKTLRLLHQHMMNAGFPRKEAAAGILGACLAMVEAEIGRDAMMALIQGEG